VQFLILLLYWKSGLPPIVQAQATVQNTNQQKGVINAEDINILSSPTQLKHDGFFRFLTCSDDVNSQTDEGAHKFTAHTVGDFYAFLVGN